MDRDFARKQIFRMAQLGGFPEKYVEAVGELIDALMTAPSEEMARAVISSVMESATGETRCPFPADIRSSITARLEPFRPDPLCAKCGGIGDVVVQRGEFSGSYRCSCWARRPEPDYSKLPGVERVDTRAMLAGAAKKLNGGAR